MTEDQIYFKHLAGSIAFLAWCRRWSHLPNGISISRQVVSLGPVAAQRFGLAWPKKKRYANGPSLLYQQTEAQWLENITWSRAVLQKSAGGYFLVLVSKLILGDESKFMNLPVFGVRIPISKDQGDIWSSLSPKVVPLRLLWKEADDGHVSNPLAQLSLSLAADTDEVFLAHEADEGLPFHEMLEHRLHQTGVELDPGFKGSAGAPVDDPYLKEQIAYRSGLKSSETLPTPDSGVK